MRKEALRILREGTVIPAIPLVLDESLELDEEGQRRLIRYYLEAGVGGIATAVHTTQFEIRDPEVNLFEKILSITAEEVQTFESRTGKTIILVAGACGPTDQAVKEAIIASRMGYDAVLLSPGGLNDYSEDQLVERTKQVTAIIPVIGFYLQPAVGGRVFTYNYWERVCDINNVVAIKVAAFDRYLSLDVVRAVAFSRRRKEISLYTGNDDNIVNDLITKYQFIKDGETITCSFVGGLLGHWSIWTGKVVKMFHEIKKAVVKDQITPGLLTLAAEVTDVNSAVFDTAHNFKGCIVGIHQVLYKQGLMKNISTLNKEEVLSPGQLEEIERVYAMYPHLNDDEFVKEFLKKEEQR